MAEQHTHARNLMKVIRERIKNGEPPIHGYSNAASMVLPNGQNYAKTYGQACSLIDAASFVAGWPMLAMHMVRKPDGAINPESFTSDWEPWNNEVKSVAESHQWTVKQVDEVISSLDGLPSDGAMALWAGYMKREMEKPGFIRFNLHRKLKSI